MKIVQRWLAPLTMTLGLAATAALAQQDGKSATPTPTPTPPAAAGKVTLVATFAPGQEIGYTQRIVRSDSMSLGGMGEQVIWMDQTNTWSAKVVSVDPKDGAVIELQFKATKIDMKQTMNQAGKEPSETKSSWDSSKPEDDKDAGNQLMTTFRPLVGARFKCTLSPTGEITAIEPLDTPSLQPTKLSTFVNQIVHVEGVRTRWQPVFALRTDGSPANVGDQWTTNTSVDSRPLGKETHTTKRTLKSIDNALATVAIEGAIGFEGLKEGEKPQADVASSAINATAIWDVQGAFCKKLDWAQKIEQNVNAQGFNVKRSYDWTMTVTRADVK